MRSFVIAVIVFCCLVSVSRAAKLDTSFTFSTIETAHFSVHFHQGGEQLARKAAALAEEAHGRLTAEFLWQPAEKTQLVLIDDSDFTNGLTVTIPYNTIYIQTVPPSLASSIGEYDDWLREVIIHEYAHVLSSDPARGYSRVMRNIFGKPLPWLGDPFTELLFIATAPPNTFLPRWWHEGMATWSESEYTGQGRGKGSYYDMVFRMAVAENNLPRIDQINGDVPYWPNGDLPYLFGYRLQKYIADTYGKDAPGQLSIEHSGRFPYFIAAPPQNLFRGLNYRDLYGDMIEAVKREQSAKISLLEKAPFTPLKTLSSDGEELSYPRFSRDGSRIAFTRRDPHEHRYVVIADRSGREIERFRRQYAEGSVTWSPDGARIYFTQAEISRGFDVYQDLYVYDLRRRSIKRLTHAARVSDVDLSPDGRLFATVVSSRGSQNLALLEADADGGRPGKPRLVTDYRMERVSSPRWSPDGKTICYAVKSNTGRSSIHLYNPGANTDVTFTAGDYSIDYPVWSKDGSSILYISDQTGVFNLYAYVVASGRNYQVSHVLGGVLQPDPSPDGSSVALSSYSSHGFSIQELSLDRSKWLQQNGPTLPVTRNLPAAPAASEDQAPARDYSVCKTVYPRFWLPRLSDDGSDKTVLGAITAGGDVLGYNTYALSVDYSPGRKRGYFDLIYDNDYFYPTLSLRGHIQPFLYSDLEGRGDYWELNQGLTLQAAVPINFLESRYLLRAGYQLLDQQALSNLDPYGRFNGTLVFEGRRDNVFAGISFEDVLRYPYSISSEEGRSISLLYRRYAKAVGSSQDFSEYSAKYQEFLRLPTRALQHHVLYLRLSGGASDGDLRYGQQYFQIGGVPSDLNDYPLRGYPDRFMTGQYVATGTLEYRAPLFYPMRGPGTFPAFLEKVHAALFVDAGEVWNDRNTASDNEVKVGAGVEARADMTLGYWLKATPALGFAHGFNRGGENQIYFTLYINL
jgi:WD40 repeat protein